LKGITLAIWRRPKNKGGVRSTLLTISTLLSGPGIPEDPKNLLLAVLSHYSGHLSKV